MGSRFGDPGFYFTVHGDSGTIWARPVRSLRESIDVWLKERGETIVSKRAADPCEHQEGGGKQRGMNGAINHSPKLPGRPEVNKRIMIPTAAERNRGEGPTCRPCSSSDSRSTGCQSASPIPTATKAGSTRSFRFHPRFFAPVLKRVSAGA